MTIDDMFLTVEEPATLGGTTRRQRKYTIKDRAGLVLGITDVAARIGRHPVTLYQLLSRLPLGTHGANFQDILRQSQGRKYGRATPKSKLIAGSALSAAIDSLIATSDHMRNCALESHRIAETRKAAETERWLGEFFAWQQAEKTRKLRRDAGEPVPVVQPPARPVHAVVAAPGCDCGREAAIDAVRATLAECQVQQEIPDATTVPPTVG